MVNTVMTAKTSGNALLQILQKRKRTVVLVVLLTGFAYVAIPQLGFFDANWQTLLHGQLSFIAAAMACLLVSFAAASFIYHQLSPKKLGFGSTYVIQIASAFAGKVLPVGLGSVSVNYLYLRKRGVSSAVAGTVVAVNNLLGFIGHGLWLLVLFVLLPSQLSGLTHHTSSGKWLGWAVISIGVAAAILLFVARRRLQKAARDIGKQLQSYARQPRKLTSALLASMVLSACNIAIVWLAAQALHIPLSIVAAAVALTTGVLGQTVTPTPGGLGGVEAGLVSGLALSGMQLQDAVTITILYRFITYWLVLALGGIALVAAVRRRLL